MHDIAGLHQSLLDDVKADVMPLTSDMDVSTARRVSLASSFFKKLEPDGENVEGDRRCLDKFVACNKLCGDFCLSPTHLYHDLVLGEMKSFFDDVFFSGPDLKLDLARIFAGVG